MFEKLFKNVRPLNFSEQQILKFNKSRIVIIHFHHQPKFIESFNL